MPLTRHDYQKIAVFVFGIIFLTAILVLVVLIPTPSTAQFFTFRLTMALAAAGIGALLPGFLNLEMPLPVRGAIRAGGALALFASVWFVNPANLGIEVKPPNEDAAIVINRLLTLTDTYDHAAAYALWSKRNRDLVPTDAYVSMGKSVRDPLGAPVERVLVSASTPEEVGGVRGPFVVRAYQTRFSNTKDVYGEVASTIPENGTWRIHTYNVFKCEPPNCQPLPKLQATK